MSEKWVPLGELLKRDRERNDQKKRDRRVKKALKKYSKQHAAVASQSAEMIQTSKPEPIPSAWDKARAALVNLLPGRV